MGFKLKALGESAHWSDIRLKEILKETFQDSIPYIIDRYYLEEEVMARSGPIK